MPTRIENRFAALRARGEKGFIAYITAGDPSLKETVDRVRCLEDIGVDIVELGIPFSDPLADGRVNQYSAMRALAGGATLPRVWDSIERIRARSDIPLLSYSYLNPMCAGNFERNVRAAAQAGLDGLLLLDLPVEESAPYAEVLRKHRLNHVCLVTPTTPAARAKRIVRAGTGFIYCVSREGVTGMQDRLQKGVDRLLRMVKSHTRLPVALGFGVSSPQQARAAVVHADAVVVGSAIVNRFHDAPRSKKGRAQAAAWIKKLVRAVKEN